MPPPSPAPQEHRFMTFVRYGIVVIILAALLIFVLLLLGIDVLPFWKVSVHGQVLNRTTPTQAVLNAWLIQAGGGGG